MDRWKLIHDYRRLQQRGNVPEITCNYCHEPLFITVRGTEPAWICFQCEVTTAPGHDFYVTMERFIEGPSGPILEI